MNQADTSLPPCKRQRAVGRLVVVIGPPLGFHSRAGLDDPSEQRREHICDDHVSGIVRMHPVPQIRAARRERGGDIGDVDWGGRGVLRLGPGGDGVVEGRDAGLDVRGRDDRIDLFRGRRVTTCFSVSTLTRSVGRRPASGTRQLAT